MARKPRLHYPGACYHVILRGNDGQGVFFTKKDRYQFYQLLLEGIEKYKHRIHAFCLMTNHIHLAIQVGDVPLSRIMQNVSFRYTRYLNHRKKRKGHLFQGRYKALLIDADSYLLELVRYIHTNPVRAGMVKLPEEYFWSSHSCYLGKQSLSWLTTDWTLGQFSSNQQRAITLYKNFVLDGAKEEHRKEFHQGTQEGRILGEDQFAEEALARAQEKPVRKVLLEQVMQIVADQYNIQVADLSGRGRHKRISEPRSLLAYIIREEENLRLVELGRRLNRDISGLSQAASRFEKKIREEKNVQKMINQINELLNKMPSSQACPPPMRQKIREVMRFASPRMIWQHPIMAIEHMIAGLRKEPICQKKVNS